MEVTIAFEDGAQATMSLQRLSNFIVVVNALYAADFNMTGPGDVRREAYDKIVKIFPLLSNVEHEVVSISNLKSAELLELRQARRRLDDLKGNMGKR